jgi:hypothetical protein
MTVLASEIIAEASKQLNDINKVTWTNESYFEYISSAQEMIVSIRPDAYSVVTTMQMAVGSRQSIPSEALRLLDIFRNMGSDGNTPGRAVLPVERNALDLFAFNWNADTQESEVKNYMYDEKVPNVFYVDPPSDGTGHLEVAISRVPPKVSQVTDVLSLKDIYRNHVIQWVMYRAYSIEVDSVSSQRRAAVHEQSFYQMMGQKFQRDTLFSGSKEIESRGSELG